MPYTDYTNNVICKRTSYIQAKHHLNLPLDNSGQIDSTS